MFLFINLEECGLGYLQQKIFFDSVTAGGFEVVTNSVKKVIF